MKMTDNPLKQFIFELKAQNLWNAIAFLVCGFNRYT
jgi:hypothetical protein